MFLSVTEKQPLRFASLMPEDGVISSDGIEADNLEFNSAMLASI